MLGIFSELDVSRGLIVDGDACRNTCGILEADEGMVVLLVVELEFPVELLLKFAATDLIVVGMLAEVVDSTVADDSPN